MNRFLLAALALAVIVPATTAQPARTPSAASSIVATINGETLTKARFDELWDRIPPNLQRQYEISGGKPAFLDNYVKKRLLLQYAFENGFASAEVPSIAALDPVQESQLFNRYIREAIAVTVVTPELIRQQYEEMRGEFAHPDQVNLRQVMLSTAGRPLDEVRSQMLAIADELDSYRKSVEGSPNAQDLLRERFAEVARRDSEDDAAERGGLVGWIGLSNLDAAVGEAAFEMPIGTMSEIIRSIDGLHILFIEGKRDAGVEPLQAVEHGIRELLLSKNMQKVIEAVDQKTAELLASSDVKMFPENL